MQDHLASLFVDLLDKELIYLKQFKDAKIVLAFFSLVGSSISEPFFSQFGTNDDSFTHEGSTEGLGVVFPL